MTRSSSPAVPMTEKAGRAGLTQRISERAAEPSAPTRPLQNFAASLLLTVSCSDLCEASLRKMLLEGEAEKLGFSVEIGAVGYAGPADGTEVPDRQAYYRPTRKRSEYRFKGWVGDEEIIRLPLSGGAG